MASRSLSDEAYVIDLCDAVLGTPALRQHGFDFLRGDARPGNVGMRLLVDAYYPDRHLVVEYRERQHTEAVPFMDRWMTLSGVDRGTQRDRVWVPDQVISTLSGDCLTNAPHPRPAPGRMGGTEVEETGL